MIDENKFIVNGVDINPCKYKYYSPSHVECKCEYTTRYGYEITSYDFCRKNPNCYFKQLKRAERECLELKFNEDNFRVDAARAKIKASKYKQALDDIEKLAKENVELLEGYHLEQANCLTILEIINQAKEQ